jgi:L-threonylcarbamoyladenylate synthase
LGTPVAIVLRATNVGSKFVLDASAVDRILGALREGGLVVHPTDTVYGLAADPFRIAAVDRLYAAKERPRELAVSIAVASVADVFRFGARTPIAEAFCGKNLPGPYTVVLQATPEAPGPVVSQAGTIGLRVPDHPIPRLLAKAFGPITSTSANRHDGPESVTCQEAADQLSDRVDVYVDGGPASLGVPSAVVDLRGARAKILRPGALPKGP